MASRTARSIAEVTYVTDTGAAAAEEDSVVSTGYTAVDAAVSAVLAGRVAAEALLSQLVVVETSVAATDTS